MARPPCTLPVPAHVSNVVGQMTGVRRYADWWDGPGPTPAWRMDEIHRELDVGYWIAKFSLYGPRGIVEAHYAEVERVVARELPTGAVAGAVRVRV